MFGKRRKKEEEIQTSLSNENKNEDLQEELLVNPGQVSEEFMEDFSELIEESKEENVEESLEELKKDDLEKTVDEQEEKNESQVDSKEFTEEEVTKTEEDLKKQKRRNFWKNFAAMVFELVVVLGLILFVVQTAKKKLYAYNSERAKKNFAAITETKPADAESPDVSGEEIIEDVEDNPDSFELTLNRTTGILSIVGTKPSGESYVAKCIHVLAGRDLEDGTYQVESRYSWVCLDQDTWNMYNTKVNKNIWIQTCSYNTKRRYTLNAKEYNKIRHGQQKGVGKTIRLRVADAKWIYQNVTDGAKLTIVSSGDPLGQVEEFPKIPVTSGWDPTDTAKGNPWQNAAPRTIAVYDDVVVVERGSEINYLANVIAQNNSGKDVTEKLRYKKIDTSEEGTYHVTYRYKKIRARITYKVVDSTPPMIRFDDLPDYTGDVIQPDFTTAETTEAETETTTEEKTEPIATTTEKSSKKSSKNSKKKTSEETESDTTEETTTTTPYDYKVSSDNYTFGYLNSAKFKKIVMNNIVGAMHVFDAGIEIAAPVDFYWPDSFYEGENRIQVRASDAYGNVCYRTVVIKISEQVTTKKSSSNKKKVTTKK